MSGRPDPAQVKTLRELLDTYNHAMHGAELNRAAIADAQARLERNQSAANVAQRSILELIEHMDCKFPGNIGWERRLMEMLSLLTRSA